jgi:hypothetical protein
MGPNLTSIVADQAEIALARVQKAYGSLADVGEIKGSVNFCQVLALNMYQHFLRTCLTFEDPLSDASYVALRNFAADVGLPSAMDLGTIGPAMDEINEGIEQCKQAYRDLHQSYNSYPANLVWTAM